MPFPVSISFPPPRDLELVGPPNVRSSIRERPKGLWRGRVTNKPSNIPDRKEKSPHIISSDPDDDSAASSSGCPAHHYRPTKRLKTDSDSDSTDPDDDDNVYYWDFARQRSAEPVDHHRLGEGSARDSRCRASDTTRAKYIVVSSIARGASMEQQLQQSQQERTTCDLDDWELLKDLFARAAENYEGEYTKLIMSPCPTTLITLLPRSGNDHAEALPLLRGVMHECHRFLTFYPDPSVLFTSSTPPPSPDEKYKGRMWSSSSSSGSKEFHRKDPKCTCFIELPTAFHALLGTALFLFGNIIAQEPSLALEGEPTSPVPYWLASLDVFETGENLPSRTSGDKPTNLPEDWRMAIVWGRSLVCLAEELVNRQSQAKDQGRDPTSVSLDIEEPKWPVESPFHAIAAQRQPITRRMTFNTATPNELLTLAMDQFSRGIFHMPHPQSASRLSPTVLAPSSSSANTSTHVPTLNPVPSPNVATTTTSSSSGAGPSTSTSTSSTSTSSLFSLSGPGSDDAFSRAKQLYTIASEVLHIAEKLESTEERQHWANWADSVLNQMKMEATTAVDMDDVWRSGILRSRGRCRLIVGSAYAEEVEAAQERGEVGVLRREEAEDARSDLVLAIELFERARAKGQEKEKENETDSDRDIDEELTTLLTEALVTLANLTEDPKERETLYARAKAEAGSDMDLDLDGEGEEEEEEDDDDDDDVKMDESH